MGGVGIEMTVRMIGVMIGVEVVGFRGISTGPAGRE